MADQTVDTSQSLSQHSSPLSHPCLTSTPIPCPNSPPPSPTLLGIPRWPLALLARAFIFFIHCLLLLVALLPSHTPLCSQTFSAQWNRKAAKVIRGLFLFSFPWSSYSKVMPTFTPSEFLLKIFRKWDLFNPVCTLNDDLTFSSVFACATIRSAVGT